MGGQALTDGVLMRAGGVWAVARADGTVETGRVPSSELTARLRHVPVLRIVASLLPALAVGLRAMPGRRAPDGRRSRRAYQLLAVVAAVTVVSLLSPQRPGLVGQMTLTLGALVALRLVTPGRLWRYHGAEHKAVTAYERGIDLDDTAAVLACPRVHDRCGTNLVAVLAVGGAFLAGLPAVVQVPAFLLLLGAAAELLTFAGRWPAALPTRAMLGPGRFLQRVLTTAEPDADQQRVACRALQVCLAEHALATTVP